MRYYTAVVGENLEPQRGNMNILTYIALATTLLIGTTAKAQNMGEKFTSFADFQLGTVKLSNIQDQLGVAEVVETGEAGEYIASVCYNTPHGVILFFAGELDGPEHDLGGFGFAKKTERKPCRNWSATSTAPTLDIGGLRLGITLKEFTDIVGTSVRVEGDRAYAVFESKEIMTEEEISHLSKEAQAMIKKGELQNYSDVLVSVIAIFSEERLVELNVWKTETL